MFTGERFDVHVIKGCFGFQFSNFHTNGGCKSAPHPVKITRDGSLSIQFEHTCKNKKRKFDSAKWKNSRCFSKESKGENMLKYA